MKPARWQHFLHREKQLLLMWLLGALVGMEFLENGMFVFASSHILGGIGVAPREFAQVQAAYAVGSMLMIAMQQWLSRHVGYRHYLLAALLRYALANGFFFAALVGVARTATSSYRSLRAGLGIAQYSEAEFLALLAAAGYAAERLPRNMEHNQTRMTFIAKPADVCANASAK